MELLLNKVQWLICHKTKRNETIDVTKDMMMNFVEKIHFKRSFICVNFNFQ